MKKFLFNGKNRKDLFLVFILIAITIILTLLMNQGSFIKEISLNVSNNMSLKEIAVRHDVPVKEILHILSHEDRTVWQLPKGKPIKNIGIDIHQLEEAIKHVREESNPVVDMTKYILWSLLLGAVLLYVLPNKKIGEKRTIILLAVVMLFGFFLGSTPNPMESLVKLVKYFNGMEGKPLALWLSFIIFTIFSIVGTRLICSWGCQLGALQESLYNIPLFKNKYTWKVPFAVSLSIRILIFSGFLVFLLGVGAGVVHNIKNFVIYHHVNYFKVFNFHDIAKIALLSFPIFIIASIFFFRPFCHFICPFGLYSWVLESFALRKIRIKESDCIKCEKCIKACPTNAMKDIYNKKRKVLLPDCWSCGKCMDACSTGAIHYDYRLSKWQN